VDAVFHAYLDVVTANPEWDDGQVKHALVRRGVAARHAEECVAFGPMAWGRAVVEQLGVSCSPQFRLHSMIDGTERDLPLEYELVCAWARAMIGMYRTAERNEVFKLVSGRSAELDAVINALHGGASKADLQGSRLQPSIVHFRRVISPEATA
jgi:hypothetical protein